LLHQKNSRWIRNLNARNENITLLEENLELKKKFSKEFCTQKMKANKTMRGQEASNHRRRKDKESESNINSATHNQTLKQQKQLNNRNHHIPININTEC
jgi:hypothetical protein